MTFTYQYFDNVTKLYFLCEFEYEAEEIGGLDNYGLKESPDIPEECYMLSMHIDAPGCDIYDLEPIIDPELKEIIKERALEEFKNENI